MSAKVTLANQPPELLEELAAHAAQVLMDVARVSEPVARDLGDLIAARVGKMMGGRKVYLPTGTANRHPLTWSERQARNRAIYEAFDGRNAEQIRSLTGLSRQHVYRILASLRLERRKSRER